MAGERQGNNWPLPRKATMIWTLENAWPSKIEGTDLKSDGNEIAVETIEIVHEKLTVANPNS